MSDLTPIERLQPCLLDRLTDDEPTKQVESSRERVVSMQRYRSGVLRDLGWLFNSNAFLYDEGDSALKLKYPNVHDSVINFGIRQLCGVVSPDLERLQEDLEAAIKVFEPRIISRSLTIHVDTERNMLTVEVEGDLWALPLPAHLHLRTVLDVENGQCQLGDSGHGRTAA
ncbi:MAG TPA: type VI secretion system baseplate subunit TssE [Candidatus Acidoferrum sp.]|nr:type VI secretion system baseplate subunit TssE [Candidatus Acidoferrum sp.]